MVPETSDGVNVLIIDDDQDTVDILRQVLEFNGMRAVTVEHLEGADVVHHALHADVCLIDMALGGGWSGIDVARAIRASGSQRIPLIAMSASPDRLEQAVESGLFSGIVDKPFDMDDLLRVVTDAVSGAA